VKKILCASLIFVFMLAVLPEGIGGWNAPAIAAGTNLIKIEAGWFHSVALCSDGSLYAWGDNRYGQVGDGTGGYLSNYDRYIPVLIGTGFTDIAAGGFHSLALKGTTLYAWGNNWNGQLGDGTRSFKKAPVKIGTGFTAIAAGEYYSLALKGNTLYAWGQNNYNQLGDRTKTDRIKPKKIGTGYTAIVVGFNHSYALKGNTLFAWGNNTLGELGDGTHTQRNTPIKISTGFTAIAAGYYHSLALKGNTLYTWGYNCYSQLGDGTLTDRNTPVQIGIGYNAIAAGGHHSLALKGNSLFTWGYNYNGELGDGTNTNRNTPMQIETGYTAITAGYAHSFAFKENAIYAWGYNAYGQLGDGTNINRNTPTRLTFFDNLPDSTLIPATGVKINPTLSTLSVGDSLVLYTTVSPNNASDKKVTWSSDNDNIATVTSEGVVTGVKAGKVTITVKTASGKTAKYSLTIKEVKATGVKLERSSVDIVIGNSFTLIASVSPSNVTNKNVTWSSGNRGIATVSSNGVIKGVKAGKVTITVKTVNSKTAKCAVTVLPLPTKVTLNNKTATIAVGGSHTLKATVTPSNAVNKMITWTSSDENIAEVSSNGKVTGMSIGTVTITASTTNGKKASCDVTVKR
jgi:uncharacterized protein YjdB